MSVSNPAPHPALFDGDDRLFIENVAGAGTYLEYGMGESTLWVLANTDAVVYAVDTSAHWVGQVCARAADPSRLHARWIDLGPLGDWGTPVTFARRHHFRDYVEGFWRDGVGPDFVLIDGRFRVACFLHSLLSAAPGTRILFDDYAGRPWYHAIEEFVVPAVKGRRQALFVVPERFDRAEAEKAREHFLYVRE